MPGGGQVSIGEVTDVEKKTIDTTLYSKNLRPVVYVLGDVAGEEESPVYAIEKMGKAIDQLQDAGWLPHQAVQRRHAHRDRPAGDEVGRRVAHHAWRCSAIWDWRSPRCWC